MGPLNASPISYQSLLIWGPIPQTAAAKAGAPDMCTRSFYGDIDDLERARGREQGRCLQASLVSGEDFSQPLDASKLKSLTHRQLLLRNTDGHPLGKDWRSTGFCQLPLY